MARQGADFERTIIGLDVVTMVLLIVVCIAVIGHVARSCP